MKKTRRKISCKKLWYVQWLRKAPVAVPPSLSTNVLRCGLLQDEDDNDDEDLGGQAVRAGHDDEGGEEEGQQGIPVQEIDAYWLQRKIAKAFGDIDPNVAQKLGEDTFAALELADSRETENKLVMLLDFDRFDLIKELLNNRMRIVWCMRLARAQVIALTLFAPLFACMLQEHNARAHSDVAVVIDVGRGRAQ